MSDQGAGGGLESHMPTHRRQDSAEEPIPTEPAPETRPAAESDPEALSPNHLPRGQRKSVSDRGGRVAAPQPLSRNPSTCSTSSTSREYLPTHTTPAPEQQQRQSPPTSHPVPASIPSLEPPVTKATLSELDVQKIVHNPKLRHDINFDPDLHFRPNLDGDKGKKKQEKAAQFWTALSNQLVLFVTDRETFHARYSHGDWCLPVLLRAVRDIIETLVPMRDRELLNEGLNVDLLMQQFYRGVADLEKLASWLASVLKLHCAPMRDDWVDDMYQALSNGNRENNVDELVDGMRSLLNVLEAMKLDVANHQIRCLRHVLIEDTVHFEQRFFMRKMESRKLNIAPSRMWYRAAQEYTERLYAGSPLPHAHAFGEMSVFFEALSRLSLPSTCLKAIPPTFIFDEDRLLKLRSDMHDSICLEICVRKFEELERLSRVTQICSKLPSYVSDEPASHRFSGDFNFMGASSSRPNSLAFSDRSSAFSSPRNSGGFFTPSTFDTPDSRSRASELYDSLLALLHTASAASSPAERWRGLAGPAALQILRYVNAPPSLHGFESQLTAWLDDVNCDTFREVEAHFHQRLMADMARRVTEFKNLAGMALFSAATGGRAAPGAGVGGSTLGGGPSRSQRNSGLFAEAPREPRDDAGVEDMAARLAHLGVLHWRVWAPLAYEGDAESALGQIQLQQQQQQLQQQQQNAMF